MTVIHPSKFIEFKISPPFFIITFVNPQSLNSLGGSDYVYLAYLMNKAEQNNLITFTILQSTGRFFSSGANIENILKNDKYKKNDQLTKWLSTFVSHNVYITHAFIKHTKIIICCLNGPAIGLSAAIVMLSDIVYSINDKVYLLFPFSRLGLITECALSVTLPMKVGYNLANEFLMFSKPLLFSDLVDKVIVKNYEMNDVVQFNEKCLDDIRHKLNGIHLPSTISMKKMLKRNVETDLQRANSEEVNIGLEYWIQGIPQKSFKKLHLKHRTNKL